MKKKNENHHSGSYMVRRNLHSIRKFADALMKMIDENDEIESWMEHKVSVAKAAISDVKDAFMYDQEEQDGESGQDDLGDDDQPHLKIAILKNQNQVQDDFGLNKMVGGCGAANEGRSFLGSATINENKQIISHNLKKKIFVESAEQFGNMIKVKTKRGETFEYIPYLGPEVELLRCEQYGVKIKTLKENFVNPQADNTLTVQQDAMGSLHIWKGPQETVQHDKYLFTTKSGKRPDFYVQRQDEIESILSNLNAADKTHVDLGYRLVTKNIPLSAVEGHVD